MSSTYTSRPLSGRERFKVLERDGFSCQYCGRRPPEATLHVDHVVPRSLGGTNDPSNLAAACRRCNLGKSASMIGAEHMSDIPAEQMGDRVSWDINLMYYTDIDEIPGNATTWTVMAAAMYGTELMHAWMKDVAANAEWTSVVDFVGEVVKRAERFDADRASCRKDNHHRGSGNE